MTVVSVALEVSAKSLTCTHDVFPDQQYIRCHITAQLQFEHASNAALNGLQLGMMVVAFHCCCFTMTAELCCCFATPTVWMNDVRSFYTYAQSQLASAEWVINFCPHSSLDYVADPRRTLTGGHLAPTVLSSSIPMTNMHLTDCHTSHSHQNP